MKNFITLAIVASAIMACNKPREAHDENAVISSRQQYADSMAAAGWKNIFDGTLNGWAVYKGMDNNSWEATTGILHCKPFDSAQIRSDLRTAEQFADFEFMFDWKLAPEANSGVMYRVSEEAAEPFFTGPEYQLIDDEGYPGDLEDWQLTGACYAMYSHKDLGAVKPVGEWNTSKILVKGPHVEHWLNGKKLFEYEFNSPGWNKLKAAGKWKDEPLYGQVGKGYIVLQDHKNEAWFRNLYIKEL